MLSSRRVDETSPGQQSGPAGARRSLRLNGAPVALWLPALVVVAVILLPLVYLFIRAWAGGDELWRMLWRERTFVLLKNTVYLAVLVTLGSVLISVPIAWLLHRTDLPLRRFWAVTTVLPLAIPSYVGGFAMVAALGPRGMLQGWLESLFGIERLPSIYGLWGAALLLTLLTYPYVLLTLNAAMSGLDGALEDAARSLGYGSWRTFFLVTLPLLRPAIAAGGLLVALYTIGEFGAVAMLRFDTFTRAIYVQYTASLDRSLAAGLALVLVLLTCVVLGVEAWTRGRGRYFRSSVGAARPLEPVQLGRWAPLGLGFCGLIVTLGLVMPVGVVLYWLVRGLRNGRATDILWDATFNSALASGLAAVAAVIAALPIVVLSVRYPSRASGLVERLCYAGYALPGIVIALSLVFFGANYALWLYQTLALLIIAYVIRFLPQALGALRAALLQVSPHYEEAARSLGSSPPKVWLRVTGPLVRSGLVSGAALVFLTVMKELPVTLLLRPIGFDTLATRIWGATADGFWTRAAGPALLLILLSAVSMFLIDGVGRGGRRRVVRE